jgi:hypothetical protein
MSETPCPEMDHMAGRRTAPSLAAERLLPLQWRFDFVVAGVTHP